MDQAFVPSPALGLRRFDGFARERLEQIIEGISRLRAGVIGDVCLDIYWHADMTLSELSRETPHYPLPVVREVFSPGAAGNVAANLKALGCRNVYYCSVLGKDWRGELLRKTMDEMGIDGRFALEEETRITPAYAKPIRHGLQGASQEDPRLDFQNKAPLMGEGVERLIGRLDQMAELVDVIAVADQFKFGVVCPEVRDRLAYWAERGKLIVVDSRDRIGLFSKVIVKPNEIEALRWLKPDADPRMEAWEAWEAWVEAAEKLSQAVGAPCCMTLGEKGSVWVDDTCGVWAPTKPADPPIDIVGAGDCFSSALACALGAGCGGPEAMAFAHLGASVVVRKLGTTGTATPSEILDRFDSIRNV